MERQSALLTLANVGEQRRSPLSIVGWAATFEFPLFAAFSRQISAFLPAALLVLFACSHVVVASSFHLGKLGDGRRAVLCGLMSVVLVVIVLRFGPGWSLLFPYLSAALAISLPGKALPVTLGLPVALAAVLTDQFGSLAVQCTVVALGMASFRRMLELVAELYDTRARMAEVAVVEERLRISRDLHDLLGQTLLSIVLKAQLIRRGEDVTEDVTEEARNIEQIGRLAIERVREAVTEFRVASLSMALDEAVSALRDAGIHTVVRERGTPFPPQVETVLGWVVREGTTNVVRHSGARECEIAVYRTDNHAVVELWDDGAGSADTAGGGHGLRGLWERLAKVGGELDAEPHARGGFRLKALVPLSEET